MRQEQPNDVKLPEQMKVVMKISAEETLSSRIPLNRYSRYLKVTARILAMYQRMPKISFGNACANLTPDGIKRAEFFWFHEAQMNIRDQVLTGRV